MNAIDTVRSASRARAASFKRLDEIDAALEKLDTLLQAAENEPGSPLWEARRFLLRHDDQFYGPMKDAKCGCPACKVIRPLVLALAAAVRDAKGES